MSMGEPLFPPPAPIGGRLGAGGGFFSLGGRKGGEAPLLEGKGGLGEVFLISKSFLGLVWSF